MAIATVRFESESLGRWTTYNVLLPETGIGPFPVVIQLHGLGDDSRSWLDQSNLARYVSPLPLIVVLPGGETSGYVNWKESGRLHRQAFEDLIVRDIPNHLRRHFDVSSSHWGIGGLSMGGYGAMRLGLKYPEMFGSIWAHSSAFELDHYLDQDLVDPENIADAHIQLHARKMLESGPPRPVISFDCGVDDELIESNRDHHSFMDRIGLEHTYTEHPGGHTWAYWDEHVREAFEQHERVLLEP